MFLANVLVNEGHGPQHQTETLIGSCGDSCEPDVFGASTKAWRSRVLDMRKLIFLLLTVWSRQSMFPASILLLAISVCDTSSRDCIRAQISISVSHMLKADQDSIAGAQVQHSKCVPVRQPCIVVQVIASFTALSKTIGSAVVLEV